MDSVRRFADAATESLGIGPSIRSITIEHTDSPWNEKALIKRKGGLLDVKITVWKDDLFLSGRVFRLFVYISDVLDPAFQYDPKLAPEEEKEPEATARYNQIWSLYVDSRMERRGVESFFDRLTRRNLFIDMEKDISWKEGDAIFQKLWSTPSFSYPEIVDLSRNLHSLRSGIPGADTPEVRIAVAMRAPHVREHVERIESQAQRELVNEILSFTAYYCKDCYITASYYGISFLFQRRAFAELIPASDDLLYLTLVNPASDAYETESLSGSGNLDAVQGKIKKVYDYLAVQSRHM